MHPKRERLDHTRSVVCPLCRNRRITRLPPVNRKSYGSCRICGLTFLFHRFQLSPEEERERYHLHQNDPSDPRYRAFLSRLTDHMVTRLAPSAEGLDYGSGPGPTLFLMMSEQGFRMANYDPFFAPQTEHLRRRYDFITCTETVEHFRRPGREFRRFNRMLRPGGMLGVMTQLLRSETDFPSWWYHRDPTHVAFYTKESMDWIGRRFGWKTDFPEPNVILFHKTAPNRRS